MLVGEAVTKLVESKVYSKIKAFHFLVVIPPKDMYIFSFSRDVYVRIRFILLHQEIRNNVWHS